MGVAAQLRKEKQEITNRWETEILKVAPELGGFTRSELVDHMPELLEGLADWVDGRVATARERFQALVSGHALQRHSTGIELETLTTEYIVLRRLLLEHLLGGLTPEELVRDLVSLEGGLDTAVASAVSHYARARDQVRERFIAILAHDLRDPLTAVSMSANFLGALVSGDKATQLVERVARGAKRIEGMIDDVLDFARGRLHGGIPVSAHLANMGDICTAAVEEARAAYATPPIELELSGDLRGHFDADRVRQALANLLANARHHGRGAPVTLRAYEADDRRSIITTVTNRGPTIPSELLGRIFQPFSRKDVRGRGLGLGLYIVEQIAVAHGGRVGAMSSTDTGTTFTIEWPRVPIEETPGRPAE